MNSKDYYADSVLAVAIKEQSVVIVEILLKHGAQVTHDILKNALSIEHGRFRWVDENRDYTNNDSFRIIELLLSSKDFNVDSIDEVF